MKRVVYGLLVLLAILHHDFWWWEDSETLVLGFLPVSLAYHAGVSIAAAVLWALAVRFCWPKEAEVLDVRSADSPATGIGERA